jgi:Fic family protein
VKRIIAPPNQSELWQDLGNNLQAILDILDRVREPTVLGRYRHWHKLRFFQPPDDLDLQRWWLGLKLQRKQSRNVPLVDASGQPFSFNTVDPLPECQHHIDSSARGGVAMPEPVTNPEMRDRYLVRSLMDEAITSSQLEGASATREVAKKMIREGLRPRDRGEQMILNNYNTMNEILKMRNEPLSRDLVFGIHRMITDRTLEDPSGAGRFRRQDEDIVVGDESGEVFHVPPPADQLEHRMEAMCRFANGETSGGFIHPLVRSIILHFWLAYDHPFIDGNGRTARALFYWSTLRHGYWLFEFVSISKIILKAPAQYGRAFLYTETDDNDLTYFILYHSNVIRRAIDELNEFIARRAMQLRQAAAELRGLTALNHRQRELIGHALRHPGHPYSIESHRVSHGIVYETARTDLMDLADRGLLIKRKNGRTWFFLPAADLEARLRTPAP